MAGTRTFALVSRVLHRSRAATEFVTCRATPPPPIPPGCSQPRPGRASRLRRGLRTATAPEDQELQRVSRELDDMDSRLVRHRARVSLCVIALVQPT